MKTLFIGQNPIELITIDSTNSYASELLRQNCPPEGTLIYTFDQQNGRGQRGNSWVSEPNKNGTLSIILYPTFLNADKQFLLTKMVSLAVADLMTEILKESIKTAEIKIKWPNDIFISGKKIAGILIENTLRDNSIKSSIIGIGININQDIFNSNIHATSLTLLSNIKHDLMFCIERLCEFIEARYLQLKANKLEHINAEYLSRLYQLNEWKNYRSNTEHFEGKVVGVASSGKLRVQLRSEEVKEFDLKEIAFGLV